MNDNPRTVPAYDLYGEENAPPREEFFHCETIYARSSRYHWSIARHTHPQLSQMLLVAHGQMDLTLGRQQAQLTGPVLVSVPSRTVHGFHFSPNIVGHVVSVSQPYLDSLARQDGLRTSLEKPAVQPLSAQEAGRLLRLGEECLYADSGGLDTNAHELFRALGEAWLRLAIQLAFDPSLPQFALAGRFQALVAAHYHTHRSLEFYASHLNCTIRTLSRQVGEAFNMTPLQLINRRLVLEARRRLRFTNASCNDVSAELGFADPAYFSRFYRRETGQRPSDERGSRTVRQS